MKICNLKRPFAMASLLLCTCFTASAMDGNNNNNNDDRSKWVPVINPKTGMETAFADMREERKLVRSVRYVSMQEDDPSGGKRIIVEKDPNREYPPPPHKQNEDKKKVF